MRQRNDEIDVTILNEKVGENYALKVIELSSGLDLGALA